jgi:hypothetical protein
MKYLLFLVVILSISFSCGNTQDNMREWGVVEYNFKKGSVPPVYQYNYKVIINRDKSGVFRYSFNTGSPENLEYTFTISEEQIDSLNVMLTKSRIFDEEIPELPNEKQPDGGPMRTVRVVVPNPDPNLDQPPKTYSSPYFPDEPYEENLNKLYIYIHKLIPEQYWSDAESKRNNYINENR